MRKLTEQSIKYLGYGTPQTKEELEFEIISLEQASNTIRMKICELKRTMYLADLATAKGLSDIRQLFGDSNENVQDEICEKATDKKENRDSV